LVSKKNVHIVREFSALLGERGYLNEKKKFIGSIDIRYGDSSLDIPNNPHSNSGKHELIVTSPPYGDNKTTVPYGQAAWLPLQWVDFADIGSDIPKHVLKTTAFIDSASLGGRRKRSLVEACADLISIGTATAGMVDRLKRKQTDGLSRFVTFISDLRSSMKSIANHCQHGTFLVWTVGNRHISGLECPLADILVELFAKLKIASVVEVKRQIPSKRIPRINNMSKTIADEYVIVFRQA